MRFLFDGANGVPCVGCSNHLTEQAIASGSLGGTTFTNALVTLQLVGNTSLVTGSSGFLINTSGAFTVNVAGIGMANLTSASDEVFDNQTFASPLPAAGFGGENGSILDNFSSLFATYDLTTAIGPVTGPSFINPGSSFATSRGSFVLTSAGDATFTATTNSIPEPATFALFGGALLAGIAARKRFLRSVL